LQLFDHWETTYPEIFYRESIGRTRAGEPIWAARISDHAATTEPEPSLLLHAAQHANECNGTNAIIFTIDRLLDRYGKDPAVTALVDGLQIWFVPVVNVDGYRWVFRGMPGWAEWRKTTRDNDHNGLFNPFADGVDTNRNWDYRWAEYDSTHFMSRMYKGPFPFSEPSVIALRDFIIREMPVIVVDYHSPGSRTLPNMIFWPWHDRANRRDGPDAPHYRPIAEEWGRRTPTEVDTVFYNGRWYSYDTLPKEQCWIYANTGICIFLMEISKQFWWEGAIVDSIAARVGRGSFYLMERALRGPGLTGTVVDAESGKPLCAEVQVKEAHDPRIGTRLTEKRFGKYWRLLSPGSYTVTVLCAGYEPVSRRLEISPLGWTPWDLRLRRAVHDDRGRRGRRWGE
jgi:hypothetical protein